MKPESRQKAYNPDTDTLPAKTPLASIPGFRPLQRLLVVLCASAVALSVLLSMGCASTADKQEEVDKASSEVAEFCRDYGHYMVSRDYLPAELDGYSGLYGGTNYGRAQEAQKDGILALLTDDNTGTKTLQINGDLAASIGRTAYFTKLYDKEYLIDETKSKGDGTSSYEFKFWVNTNSVDAPNIEMTRENYNQSSAWTISIAPKETP